MTSYGISNAAMNLSLNSEMKPFRFCTDGVPSAGRAAMLREAIGRTHLRLDIEPLGGAPLRAAIEQHSWPSASLLFCDITPVSASRTKELLSDNNDDFRLLRAEGTPYHFIRPGETAEVRPPDAGLIYGGAIGTVRFPGPCRISSIRIPRERLSPAVKELKPFHALAWSSPPLRLFAGYADHLRRLGPTEDPVIARRISDHLIELLAFALEPVKEGLVKASSAIREARLTAIRADILANLSKVRLSAKTVARRHGVTDRYVHLLFEETGETFSRFVTEERLKQAYQLLTNPSRAAMRISDIAGEVGFSELSTFNRAFRRRFGDTPSAVRQSKRCA
jgi:AraC-like DNA-binding protein